MIFFFLIGIRSHDLSHMPENVHERKRERESIFGHNLKLLKFARAMVESHGEREQRVLHKDYVTLVTQFQFSLWRMLMPKLC